MKKPIKTKKDLKSRLRSKAEKLKKKGGDGQLLFVKEGTIRYRVMNPGEDNDFSAEVIQFYLGPEIKGVISPASMGKPCAIMEKYEALKKSKRDSDKELAKRMVPKTKFLIPVVPYKDLKGKEVDEQNAGRLLMVTKGITESAIDLYLDDDWGDMTDPINGYDIKIKREGSTMTDTEYSLSPCPRSKAPKGFGKPIDLEKMVEAILPSYEETEEILAKYMSTSGEEEEDNGGSKKKVFGKKKKKKDL